MDDDSLTRTEFVRHLDARDEKWRVDIDAREERLRTALEAGMDVRGEQLRDAFNIQTEKLRDDIRKAAEGYGATLERIERTLREIQRDSHVKWELHDYVLKDHAARITKLERGDGGG